VKHHVELRSKGMQQLAEEIRLREGNREAAKAIMEIRKTEENKETRG
jgi:hypothetical protein